ncbi:MULTISPECIES: ferritin-like domain-containing protein [Tissierellales]|uniref:Bacterioferritin n=1 Tax=Acidilutibacter cellobiosedens TaxID=2507161 RepID=A0A410Q9X4_9FIRM|nr:MULTISPECIES: ferritin-like domain-containing protein [Tissierellales]MBE6081800.1 bacterioferritin [Tissierellaceae bacterium]QAT60674.1 bacterioferritin [Acidilutibacter cellobiosedens]SCL91232.1 Bacterioferritin [Sporanaerobacter sp. PP17-6a]
MKQMGGNEIIHGGYADPSPYPEIKVLGENKLYAEILMDDYAGGVSEFTAINQYLYHYFISNKEAEEVANMWERISITEMHHMEMLAETILLLGGNPIYRGSQNTNCCCWNAGYVYYGCNLCGRLHADLMSEYEAIRNYERHIKEINDPYVQAILARIILDEKVHIEHFNKAIGKYCGW